MKSRIPVDERALYFHMGEDGGEFTAVEAALKSLRIPVRRLSASCLDETLGALAAPTWTAPAETGTAPEGSFRDALIFCSLTRPRLDEALAALKKAQAGGGALKAVLTGHNQSWRMRTLIGELEKEDALMNRYQQLHLLMKGAVSVFEKNPNDSLADALERAQAALNSREPSLQALQEAEEALRGLLEVSS